MQKYSFYLFVWLRRTSTQVPEEARKAYQV